MEPAPSRPRIATRSRRRRSRRSGPNGSGTAGQGRAAARRERRAVRPQLHRPHSAWRDRRDVRRSRDRSEGRGFALPGGRAGSCPGGEHGKACFLTLRDGWDDLQIYANVDTLGETSFSRLTDIDVGDIIGCEGHVFRTRRGELTVFAESWTAAHQVAAAPAREVARPARPRDPLPSALRGPDRQSRGGAAAARPRQAGLGHAPLPGRPGLRGGGDPDPAAAARRRTGPALRHASQRARHRPLPAHSSRALPQAAAGGRFRPHL